MESEAKIERGDNAKDVSREMLRTTWQAAESVRVILLGSLKGVLFRRQINRL